MTTYGNSWKRDVRAVDLLMLRCCIKAGCFCVLFSLFEGDKVRDMVRFITPLPLVDRLRKHRVKRWKRGEVRLWERG